ncbi:DUF192 domain-containing protein [Candidatus Woesearchaeota archaeon]|nr:DUF192 domain-containing protein [Candidatus Woesearchaeota archaeon]
MTSPSGWTRKGWQREFNIGEFRTLPCFGTLALILLTLSACSSEPRVIINGNSITAELARTAAEQSTGLMYRERLDENAGMLFIFGNDAPRTFWMKNTKIPLDMIVLSSDKRVVAVTENVQPCTEDPCRSYPLGNGAYVLEVNAGYVAKHNILVGQSAEFYRIEKPKIT